MTYTGNNPVVAHPPCQLWGKMAKINYVRWGGEHNRPGNDGGCFRFALDSVNRCGGVLEHPAQSRAWAAHGLPAPGISWTRWKHGWVCEVAQSAYGHKARKLTWLYCSGTESPILPNLDKPKGSHQIGFRDYGRAVNTNKPTLGDREANAISNAIAATAVCFGLAVRACFSATDDLGNNFADHGVAAPFCTSRGIVATVDGAGAPAAADVGMDDRRPGISTAMASGSPLSTVTTIGTVSPT
jgi:hypothetical protein